MLTDKHVPTVNASHHVIARMPVSGTETENENENETANESETENESETAASTVGHHRDVHSLSAIVNETSTETVIVSGDVGCASASATGNDGPDAYRASPGERCSSCADE